ncbi:IL20RA [Branchiostoma lanceolatum]|uniref:IL20RA protein n=1 Tax=Branchiostoma lanceolatum TaxID=7740 RepID=A0A8J9Z0X3_BRALA|nr:IL20RA [Branchiostoma lanceolatum]
MPRSAEPEPAIPEAREIQPPTDVTWTSRDLNHSLIWRPAEDAGPGTTYTVECRLGQGPWQTVIGCENTTAHVCLMNDATDYMGGWTARVSAHDQTQSSDWAVSPSFRPAKDTILSTPHLGLDNLEVGTDEVTVTCKLPITPFEPDDDPWHYFNAKYTLTWWKEGDNDTSTMTGKVLETSLTVEGLHPGTSYCLTAMLSIRVPPERNSDVSKVVCVTTKERIPSVGPRNISLKPLPINCVSPSVRDVIISWADSDTEVAGKRQPYEVKSYDVKWNDHGKAGDPGSMAVMVNATDRSMKVTCLGSVEVEVRACNTAGCSPPTRGVLKFSGDDHIKCKIWTSVAVLVACCIGLALLVAIIICCRKTGILSKEHRAKKSKLPSILEEVVKGSGDGSYWPVSDRPRPEVYDVVPTNDEISKLTAPDTSSDGTNSTSEEVFTPDTPSFSDVSFHPGCESPPLRQQKNALESHLVKDERPKLVWDPSLGMETRRPHHDSSSTYVSSITDTTSYTSDLDSPQPQKAAKVIPWAGNASADNSYVSQSQLKHLQPAGLTNTTTIALPKAPNSNVSTSDHTPEEKQDFRKYSGPKSPSKMTADQASTYSKKMPKCAPKILSEEISDYVSVG